MLMVSSQEGMSSIWLPHGAHPSLPKVFLKVLRYQGPAVSGVTEDGDETIGKPLGNHRKM